MENEIVLEPQKPNAANRCGWFFFAFCLLLLAVFNIACVVLARLAPSMLNSTVWLYLLQYGTMYGIALPLSFLILRPLAREPIAEKRLPFFHFVVYFLLGIGCMMIGSILGRIVTLPFELLFGSGNPLDSLLNGKTLLFSSLLTVVVAPIGEELVFRKLVIDRLARHGTVVAVALSALFFGLFHQNFYQFFYATLLGLVLGYLYASTGRLRYCIFLHSALNFLCGVVPNCLNALADWTASTSADSATLTSVLSLLAGIVGTFLSLFELACALLVVLFCVFFLKKSLVLQKGRDPITIRDWYRAILNGGVIAAVAFCGMLMLLSLLPI